MPPFFLIKILPVLTLICAFANLVTSQQAYAPSSCLNSTSAPGYTCNGFENSCQTYIIFRARPPYNSASSIATLLGSDRSQITQINSISDESVLITRKEVIVPINCSCSGSYYQSNTSYVVEANETPYLIANNTFEGLTTCVAIQNQRTGNAEDIFPDERLSIPLRCACPTKNQSDLGIKHLMTYVIKSGDAIASISLRFEADVGETLEANEKSGEDSVIQPFTTLLVPLRNPPNSSMTITPSPSPPSPPPASSAPSRTSPSSGRRWDYFVYGLIAGASFMLILGAAVFCLLAGRIRKREEPLVGFEKMRSSDEKHTIEKLDDSVDIEPLELLDSISSIAKSLKVYSFKDLQSATDDNFGASSWIGGSVYHGSINHEQQQKEIAIRKTNGDVSREIGILNKINHVNIITLLGVCYNDGLWYLVYDYASNGSLSHWIYQSNSGLSWTRRVQIALDVATGLDYLHSYTSPPHVHKDINCSHVLLDSEFRAKISDFGLSKSVGEQGDAGQFALTSHIVGTKGYMAPEYVENGLVTPKMDVYAFGVLLVEILTGSEASLLCNGENVYLCDVLERLGDDQEKLKAFMDPTFQDKYPTDVATTIIRLAGACVRKEAGRRPAMGEIARSLSKALTSSLMQESFAASDTTTSSRSQRET